VANLCATIVRNLGFGGGREGGRGGVGEWDQSTIVLSTYYRHKMHTFEKKEAISN
jgi:hypothetical protein